MLDGRDAGATPATIQRLRSWVAALLRERVAAEPVAAMRIGVALLWLYELAQLVPWRSYLYPDISASGPLLAVWIVATVCLLVGFRPRVAALVSLVCFIRFLDFGTLLFRAESYAHLATFYLVFMDSGRCWSLDAWRRRRQGVSPDHRILALPVFAYLLHLGISYFDVGWTHLLLNDSWREGFAVSQSFLQPSAGSHLGASLAAAGWLPTVLNWFTIAYEVGFLVVLAVYIGNRRLVHLRTALGIAGVGFHLGITLFYRLGIFGPLMVAMVLPLLPIRGRRRAGDVADGSAATCSTQLAVGAVVILALALFASAPVLRLAQAADIDRVRVLIPKTYRYLGLTGDDRPNNIFSQALTSLALSIETEPRGAEGQLVVWPLLFDSYGRRAGVTEFYPVFVRWLTVGGPMAHAALNGSPFPPDWQQRLRASLTPVLEKEMRSGGLRHATRVDVFLRAWDVPATVGQAGTGRTTPRLRLASVTLAPPTVVGYEFCAPEPANTAACRG